VIERHAADGSEGVLGESTRDHGGDLPRIAMMASSACRIPGDGEALRFGPVIASPSKQ
jgi:hypothetical protein